MGHRRCLVNESNCEDEQKGRNPAAFDRPTGNDLVEPKVCNAWHTDKT